MALALAYKPPVIMARGQDGLLVVTSFPNLACDLELLALEGDEVIPLVPPGVDPHDYQLTPSDVEVLRKADIIISTAHTPFEMEIKDLWARGELKGALVEVPRVPGVELLRNPMTGQINYHMPTYDPGNLMAFVSYLADLMASLRPDRAGDYASKASAVIEAINSILSGAPKLSCVAVADLPFAQYAVNWLGVEVRFLVVKEHGVPATPGDLMRIEEAMSSGEVELAVVCAPTTPSPSRRLEELAEEHGIPILHVPSPSSPESTLSKLARIAEEAAGLSPPGEQASGTWDVGLALALASSIMVLVALAPVLARRR